MKLASKLPASVVDKWHNVISFVGQKIQPAIAWSGGVSTALTGMFQSSTDSSQSDAATLAATYGTSESVAKEIEKLTTKYFFAEDVRGGTEEAKLCLKMGGKNLWLICEDYKEYLKSLLKQEDDRSGDTGTASKLEVKVYYAESDMMIGEVGKIYFEECWRTPKVLEQLDFDSQTLTGTDHETVLVDFQKGAVPSIFDEIKSLSPSQGVS